MKFAIACDFDGTITLEDTGKLILSAFTDKDWRYYDKLVIEGKIGTREALDRQYELIENIDIHKLNQIIETVPIDPSFADFLKWVQINHIPFFIVSDGFKEYITKIFDIHDINVDSLEIYANSMTIKNNRIEISYLTPPCEHGCANCKYSHIKRYKDQNFKIIYIGDGHSDILPAKQLADIIFARKGRELAKVLTDDQRVHVFTNFNEIIRQLQQELDLTS